jgi:hypothetical protein
MEAGLHIDQLPDQGSSSTTVKSKMADLPSVLMLGRPGSNMRTAASVWASSDSMLQSDACQMHAMRTFECFNKHAIELCH